VTGSKDKTVRIWNAADGKELLKVPTTGWVDQVSLSPDSGHVAASFDKALYIWNAVTGDKIAPLRHRSDVDQIVFSPDGHLIAGAYGTSILTAGDTVARVWSADTGSLKFSLKHKSIVTCVAFSRDGRYLIVGTIDGDIDVWDMNSGQEHFKLSGHDDAVLSVAVDSANTFFVSGSADRTARVWDFKSGKLRSVLRGHLGWVSDAKFLNNGASIATASRDGTLRIWDLKGVQTFQFPLGSGKNLPNGRVDVIPNTTKLVTLSDSIQLWDLSNVGHRELSSEANDVAGALMLRESIVFSPDASRILIVPEKSPPALWNINGRKIAELSGHTDNVYAARFSPDGKRIVSSSADGTFRVWDGLDGHLIYRSNTKGLAWDASFSPSGQQIVIVLNDSVQIYDAANYHLQREFHQTSQIYAARLNRSGSQLFTSDDVNVVRLWETDSGDLIATIGQKKTDPVHYAEFNKEGNSLITASGDGLVTVWDSKSGKEIKRAPNLRRWLDSARFNPDGNVVAIATDSGPFIWKFGRETQLDPLQKTDRVRQIFFGASSRFLIASTVTETRLYDAATGALLETFNFPKGIGSTAVSDDGRWIAVSSDGAVHVKELPSLDAAAMISALRARSFYGLNDTDLDLLAVEPEHQNQATAQSCDMLASDPLDPGRTQTGYLRFESTSEAIDICQSALQSDPDNARTRYQLGFLQEAKKNLNDAEAWYLRAKDLGYPMAYFRLAKLYERGRRGISQDVDKAFAYYQSAFQHGIYVAGSYLGEMLWQGEGVQSDEQGAKQVWTVAAQLGDARSHIKLARLSELPLTAAGIEQALLHYSIATRLIEKIKGEASVSRNRRATIANSLPAEKASQIYEVAAQWKPRSTSLPGKVSSAGEVK
jgi:WD40 repeat protein